MGERSNRVHVLDIDGRPTLAFHAVSQSEARQLTKEAWLKDDLLELRSGGLPLWKEGSAMSTRTATDEENAAFEVGEKEAAAVDELTLVYLVAIDEQAPPTQ